MKLLLKEISLNLTENQFIRGKETHSANTLLFRFLHNSSLIPVFINKVLKVILIEEVPRALQILLTAEVHGEIGRGW
jgi:hypothetical protein